MTESRTISISIPKDKLTELPTVNFNGHISVIDTFESAKSAIHFLSNQKIVGFDTETRPSFRKGKRYNVSLIQISTINHCFLFRINKLGFFDELKQFIVRYEDVESVIGQVKGKLESANYQLKKDIEVCNRYLEQNLNYINELDNFIMAGKIKAKEEQEALDGEKSTADNSDLLVVQMLNSRQNEIDRFERKLHNLLLVREIAVQNIPQIMLIRDGDGVLIEKIDTSINSAIPLWESQMVIAIQLLRQKGALAIQKAVTNTTNNLIEKNGELLKSGSIEVAKELETGIVNVETLKKNSQNLIDTLAAIKQIRAKGKEDRIKATQELGMLQSKLNEQLLLEVGQN